MITYKGKKYTLEDFLEKEVVDDHYLKKAYLSRLPYFDNFKDETNHLFKRLTAHQIEDFLHNKLQLVQKNFNEIAFISIACETSVNNFFSSNESDSFIYEPKLNDNDKNVESQIECKRWILGGNFRLLRDYKFNIEVKCGDFSKQEAIIKADGYKLGFIGRNPEFLKVAKELELFFQEGQKNLGQTPKPFLYQHNLDNKLKDFLFSAGEKFSKTSSEKELNVLFVCCNNPMDMQRWFNYLAAEQGLFTNESFVQDKNKYDNVDLVVLTNLYFRHKDFFKKQHLSNNWNVKDAFNIVCENPFRKKKKVDNISFFMSLLPNYNNDLNLYKYDTTSSNIPVNILNSMHIFHFIVDYLEKQKEIYLFEEKSM